MSKVYKIKVNVLRAGACFDRVFKHSGKAFFISKSFIKQKTFSADYIACNSQLFEVICQHSLETFKINYLFEVSDSSIDSSITLYHHR